MYLKINIFTTFLNFHCLETILIKHLISFLSLLHFGTESHSKVAPKANFKNNFNEEKVCAAKKN